MSFFFNNLIITEEVTNMSHMFFLKKEAHTIYLNPFSDVFRFPQDLYIGYHISCMNHLHHAIGHEVKRDINFDWNVIPTLTETRFDWNRETNFNWI